MFTIDRTPSGQILAYVAFALALVAIAMRRLGVEAGSAWTVGRPTERPNAARALRPIGVPSGPVRDHSTQRRSLPPHAGSPSGGGARSEERRVGKEWRGRGARDQEKK